MTNQKDFYKLQLIINQKILRCMKSLYFKNIAYFFQNRSFLALIHDTFIVILSLQISLFMRLGEDISQLPSNVIVLNTLLYVLFGVAVFLGKHMYRGMWRYSSLEDLVSISLSVTYITIFYLSVMFILPQNLSLPRSTPFINWFVLTAFLGAPRLVYRLYRQQRHTLSPSLQKTKTVLIVGSGDQTESFIREILRQHDETYHLLGIIGSKNVHIGQKIHHIQVMGTIEDLPDLVEDFRNQETPPDMLIVADENLAPPALKSLVTLADSLNLPLKRLPRRGEIKDPTEQTRVKSIVIEDLLGRPQTSLDRESMRDMIKGKRVLVTGAGGTIGGELVRQISDFGPSRLCLVDHSEYLLYMSGLELHERHPTLSFDSILADVTSQARIHHVISEFKPELVFHAAALKHVPLVEENPSQASLTNIIGTRNVADACRAWGVKVMLLISTDKAINPSSAMGATKRLAESYCQSLDILERHKPGGTRYASVRFGNVLGSSGSVVPLFTRQIKKGGPITLTHPDMTRYFMTVQEAVELVLQATAFSLHSSMKGGRVFVLDMGEPVKILDMAKQMISLAGLKFGADIEIKYTGLRPGEKLFEELFHTAELLPTNHASIMLGSPRTADHGFLMRALQELETIAKNQDDKAIIALLHTLVPEYQTPPHPQEAQRKVRG
jgi:O-antigen biosynthesis protein WbqV